MWNGLSDSRNAPLFVARVGRSQWSEKLLQDARQLGGSLIFSL